MISRHMGYQSKALNELYICYYLISKISHRMTALALCNKNKGFSDRSFLDFLLPESHYHWNVILVSDTTQLGLFNHSMGLFQVLRQLLIFSTRKVSFEIRYIDFRLFWQFSVVTGIQYIYQKKAFFRVYNFCIYVNINIWHHGTVFYLCLQNQGLFTKSRAFSHSYISRTLLVFILRIISLESLGEKEYFDIFNTIV